MPLPTLACTCKEIVSPTVFHWSPGSASDAALLTSQAKLTLLL